MGGRDHPAPGAEAAAAAPTTLPPGAPMPAPPPAATPERPTDIELTWSAAPAAAPAAGPPRRARRLLLPALALALALTGLAGAAHLRGGAGAADVGLDLVPGQLTPAPPAPIGAGAGAGPATTFRIAAADGDRRPTARPHPGPEGAREAPTDPPCDGRGILIHESVWGPEAGRKVNAALAAHPGSVYASAGACPSLNPEREGYPVYAVYEDFGHDLEALCAADRGAGTMSRIMTTEQDRGEYCPR